MPGFGKDGKGQIGYSQSLTSLGTLAATTALSCTGAPALTEDFRVTKLDYWMAVDGLAGGERILVGMADGELSISEIEEALESGPIDRNDNAVLEQSHRPVWPLEILQGTSTVVEGKTVAQGSVTPRWTFGDADSWEWWVYNLESGALTTGADLKIFTKWFGVWVT